MKIEIIGKNGYKPTKKIISFVEKKLAKVLKFFKEQDVKDATVLLKDYKDFKKVEITLTTKLDVIRSEEKGIDFQEIIDISVDKIIRQITKHKERLQERYKEPSHLKENSELDIERLEKEILAKQLIKNKKIDLKPMTKDEAILSMDLVGHAFYIYYDISLDTTCVIYKREDGGVALIETNFSK